MNDAQRSTAFQLISRRIAKDAALIRHWPLTGGVSAAIDALELEVPDGEQTRFVVRRTGDHEWKAQAEHTIEMEYTLQQALFHEGLPIAEQVLLDTTCEILPTPFAVMKMVEGDTEVPASKVERAMRSMAEFLLRLHQLDPDSVKVTGLPPREDPVAGALLYIPDTPQWSELRQAVSSWQTTDVSASILHGDFWPGNIIWLDDQIAAVIDWEDAATGTPVSDLGGCRAEIMAMYGPRAVALFTDYYHSQATLDFSDQPLWDVYCGFAALATMHSWGLDPGDEAARRASTELFVKQAADQIIAQ